MPLSFTTTSFSGLSFGADANCLIAPLYKNPELGTDYGADFDIMVMTYLHQEWCITTPAELKRPESLPSDPDDPSDPAYIANSYMRFKRGFPDDIKPFSVNCLQGDIHDVTKLSTGKGAWSGLTDVWVTCKALSLGRDGRDNESDQFTYLGIMERNVERIANQYRHGGITGIMDLIWRGGGRIYSVRDSWASSLWGSKSKIEVYWYKVNEAG